MGNILMNNEQDRSNLLNHLAIFRPTISEELSNFPSTWNPAFNEFQFGDTPQNINSKLPKPFSSITWETMPQADEYPNDIVKYFWLTLKQFGNGITKFIPPNTTVNKQSYICFLFVHEKLFNISIRLFYDNDKHKNYNEIIEAYAKAVNTPLIESEQGKEFYYEDNRILYFSCFHPDKSHVIIEVIRKGQTTTTNAQTFPHVNMCQRQPRQTTASIELLLSPQPYKYDMMISYSHKDKEFCHGLYYRLRDDHYRVWIDLENMYGPIVQRMAEAIENSEFVLICMSNSYKSSTYCQLEAEYAFKYQTCLVPLVIKDDFTQTGWLGMLCGLRLQIDFTQTSFDEAYQRLRTEIQRYRTQSTNRIQAAASSSSSN